MLLLVFLEGDSTCDSTSDMPKAAVFELPDSPPLPSAGVEYNSMAEEQVTILHVHYWQQMHVKVHLYCAAKIRMLCYCIYLTAYGCLFHDKSLLCANVNYTILPT